jgi:hypothetical protein
LVNGSGISRLPAKGWSHGRSSLLLMVATYFGVIPGRHVHYNPHSLIHW